MFPPISYSDYQCLSCELPMRRLLSFIAFAAWMFVAGCAIPNIYIDVERQAETGILPPYLFQARRLGAAELSPELVSYRLAAGLD